MLTYKASYKLEDGVMLGSVLDFPGTISFGSSLDEARRNLASALQDMAETNLIQGEPLPLPNQSATDPDADLEESIHLMLQAGHRLLRTVGASVS